MCRIALDEAMLELHPRRRRHPKRSLDALARPLAGDASSLLANVDRVAESAAKPGTSRAGVDS
ncbi:hypothetical protein GCM10023317_44320 [Actinopolymorpha pittospori]